MSNYFLLCILSMLYVQTVLPALVVAPCKEEERIREYFLQTTKLPEVLIAIIFAYMDEFQLLTLLEHSNATAAAFNADGTLIATTGYDGFIRVWDTMHHKLVAPPFDNKRDSMLTTLSFSPDGVLLAAAGQDYSAYIWHVESQLPIAALHGHESHLHAISFNHYGDTVATASEDKTVRLWDVTTGQSVLRFARHTDFVCSASFGMEGPLIASAGNDKKTYVWDTRSGKRVHKLPRHKDDVNSVSFSPDNTEILTASDDKTVGVWDMRQKKRTQLLSLKKRVGFASFDSTGERIITAGEGKIAHIFNAKSGAELEELNTGAKPVYLARFSPDDTRVATASGNRVLLWSRSYNTYKSKKITLNE